MDIEAVAAETPELIFTEEIDPKIGLQPFQMRKVAFNLGLKDEAYKNMVKFVAGLYKAYEGSDASLFEINPVFKTSDIKFLPQMRRLLLITMPCSAIPTLLRCVITMKRIPLKWKHRDMT